MISPTKSFRPIRKAVLFSNAVIDIDNIDTLKSVGKAVTFLIKSFVLFLWFNDTKAHQTMK